MSRATCRLYTGIYYIRESQDRIEHHVHENKSYDFVENLSAIGSKRLMAIVECIILYCYYMLKNVNIKIIRSFEARQ